MLKPKRLFQYLHSQLANSSLQALFLLMKLRIVLTGLCTELLVVLKGLLVLNSDGCQYLFASLVEIGNNELNKVVHCHAVLRAENCNQVLHGWAQLESSLTLLLPQFGDLSSKV